MTFDAEAPPDLTIDIARPDGHPAAGRRIVTLRSPHALTADPGPHEIDLGDDVAALARALTDEARQAGVPGTGDGIDATLESLGRRVAGCLPPAVWQALADVAARTKPRPPALLILGDEPALPWELAWLDAPVSPSRPPFLGAQVWVGRWWRTGRAPLLAPPTRLAVGPTGAGQPPFVFLPDRLPDEAVHGGCGGAIGALWAVDDDIAHDIATTFWQRARPADPDDEAEPVADVLRDLRALYAAVRRDGRPVPTYLAYVFYGHPRLLLEAAA